MFPEVAILECPPEKKELASLMSIQFVFSLVDEKTEGRGYAKWSEK